MLPAINTLAAICGIVGLVLIIARLGYSRGLTIATLGFIVAYFGCSLTFGYLDGFYYCLFYSMISFVPAIFMGWAARNLRSPGTVVVYGFIPMAFLFLLFMFLYSGWIKDIPLLIESLDLEMETLLKTNPDFSSLIEKNVGAGDEAMARFMKEFNQIIERAIKIIPGFLLIGLFGIAMISFSIAGFVAAKLSVMLPRFKPFYLWKASEWWLLPTFIGLVPVVFSRNDLWFYAGLNILIVTGHVYMIVGLAIMEAYFKKVIVPTPIRVIFYVVLFLGGPVSMAFLAVLGLADTKFNFKREIDEVENKD